MNADELRARRAELSQRRDRLRADLLANQERRLALSFDSECGVASARKEINKLIEAAVALDVEARTVEAALAEAGRRVAAAEDADRGEQQRAKARAALALLDDFETRGAALSDKLAGFIAEYEGLCADFRKLEIVGFPPTSAALISANMRRAVASALIHTDLRQEFVPPNDRTTFSAVIAGWASNVRGRSGALLNRKINKAE